jgi:hypothetical protein
MGKLANLQDVDGRPVAGAEVANVRAKRHGFWALAEIERNPRTAAIAEWLMENLPISTPGDEVAVWLLAGCIERRIRGLAEIEEATTAKQRAALRRDLSTVENTAARLLDQLGLTPTSRARLGLDLSRTGDALAAHLDHHYGSGP